MPKTRLGLTTRGSALTTAGLTALVCGAVLGQRDLVRVALLLILAPVVAAVVVHRSRVSIACERSVEPARVPSGTPVVLRLSLSNQSVLPTGSLMLEDHLGAPFDQRARFTLDSLRGREKRSLAYRLPLVGRGHYRVGPLRMHLADPFGLVERARSFRSVSDVVILPAVDALPETGLPGAWDSSRQAGSHSVGSHGSDDASIRQYRHGDDLRKVHWRSTARLGSMMVRQEERPWHGRSTLLLDTRASAHRRRGPMDDPVGDGASTLRAGVPGTADPTVGPPDARTQDSFEWAVSAAASIAVHLNGKGRELDVIAGGVSLPSTGPGFLLDRLAELQMSDAAGLTDALALTDANGRDSNIIAVLGKLDETTLRLLTARHRSQGSALVLLLDTLSWIGPSRRLSTQARQVTEDGRRRAAIALTGAGWRVQVVTADMSIADAWSGLMAQLAVGASASTAWARPTGPTAPTAPTVPMEPAAGG